MLSLNHFVAQSRSVGDEDFQLFLFLFHGLVEQSVITVQTSLTLSLAGLGSHTHPFQLTLQCFAPLALLLFFLSQPLCLLFQPTAIVALPRNAFTTVKFQNPSSHVVKEVTVVGNGYDRAFILLEMLLQPINGFGIQMVRGLVEQKYVGFL